MEQCYECENFDWCSSEEMDCSTCPVKGSEKHECKRKNIIIKESNKLHHKTQVA